MPLTHKQQIFVREYQTDFNATRAALAAGYSEKTADSQGSRLLKNVKVATEIAKSTLKRAEKLEISADYVLGTIKNTIERCAQEFPVRDKEGNETGEYQFEPNSVLKGCELLGKHLKLFTEKVEHSGQVEHVDLSALSSEQLATIESIVESAHTDAR